MGGCGSGDGWGVVTSILRESAHRPPPLPYRGDTPPYRPVRYKARSVARAARRCDRIIDVKLGRIGKRLDRLCASGAYCTEECYALKLDRHRLENGIITGRLIHAGRLWALRDYERWRHEHFDKTGRYEMEFPWI
jgi:hypothetical protein